AAGMAIGAVLDAGHQLALGLDRLDRKSTRLNSSHVKISYAVFCLKKKTAILRDSDTGGRHVTLPASPSLNDAWPGRLDIDRGASKQLRTRATGSLLTTGRDGMSRR